MIEKCKTLRRISIILLGALILSLMATAGLALAAPPQEDNVIVVDIDDGDWVDWFAVAAETIEVDEDTLFTALENDKSIADVAQEKGIDLQKVIDAIVAAETDWINQQVAEDNLSKEEADEWLKYLPEDARLFVEEKGLDILELDCDDDCDWVNWFAVTAQTIGIDEDTLDTEVENGKSIADVAQEKGIDPQKVIDAIVVAETDWINQQVAEGNLSKEEADEWLTEVEQFAKEFVETILIEEEVE